MAHADLVGVMEAAYADAPDDHTWLTRVAEALRPAFERGDGMAAWTFRMVSPTWVETSNHVLLDCHRWVLDAFDGAQRLADDETYEVGFRKPRVFATFSQTFELTEEQCANSAILEQGAHPAGFADLRVLTCGDPSGTSCMFFAPLRSVSSEGRRDIARWSRVAAHISAGYRLHRSARASSLAPPSELQLPEGTEAVLDARGRVQHASGEASEGGARRVLREAALASDRARSKKLRRDDPDESLALWRGLVAGRWSLVDHFDTDGRRFLVARRNAPRPGMPLPDALTLREQQLVAYAVLGHSSKLMAYELGLSESTVSKHLTQALDKLGLKSRVELVSLLAPSKAPAGDGGAA